MKEEKLTKEGAEKLTPIERLIKARTRIRVQLKCNAKNEFQNCDYATLNHVLKVCQPILNSLFLEFFSQIKQGGDGTLNVLNCFVVDLISGTEVDGTRQSYVLPSYEVEKTPNKVNQFMGATLTYSIRYLLYVILNVSPSKDKDGLSERAKPEKTTYQKRLNDRK